MTSFKMTSKSDHLEYLPYKFQSSYEPKKLYLKADSSFEEAQLRSLHTFGLASQ